MNETAPITLPTAEGRVVREQTPECHLLLWLVMEMERIISEGAEKIKGEEQKGKKKI